MQQHVYAIAKACAEAGVTEVVVCPGSRSAPLVFAFHQKHVFRLHQAVDERSAAYMALGMAQWAQKPVVLICTSGTAALNFYPAIAEAYYQHVPLLVLTADRPPALLNQQDGQMINQQGVYGTHVLATYTMPCFAHEDQTMDQAFAQTQDALRMCSGLRKGPVHINVPLAEPLYPSRTTHIRIATGKTEMREKPKHAAIPDSLKKYWADAKRILLIAGQAQQDYELYSQMLRLRDDSRVIIIADPLSNQFAHTHIPTSDYMLMRADEAALFEMQPDFILSYGGPLVSKSLKMWLKSFNPSHHYRINLPGEHINTYNHSNITHLHGYAAPILAELPTMVRSGDTHFRSFWKTTNEIGAATLRSFFNQAHWHEPGVVHQVLRHLPDASNVHIANSSAIRYVSLGGWMNPSWVMSGNRGTSGIDGCTSTALGAAYVNNRETFLITGDLAFLYDCNAFWQNQLPDNLKVIVLNNGEGQIFRWIDGPSAHPEVLPYFTTPHQRNIKSVCLAFSVKHLQATSYREFKSVWKSFLNHNTAAVLELKFDAAQNQRWLKVFKELPLRTN